MTQKVLTMPRTSITGMDGFVPWSQVSSMFNRYNKSAKWFPRQEAEQSIQWVQPIPCCIFRNTQARYCLLRYPQKDDHFSLLYSLIVGGHIDSNHADQQLMAIFLQTLKREVQEEVGVTINDQPTPIGLTVDSSSIPASRHIGVVYEIEVLEQQIRPQKQDEFSTYSNHAGKFLNIHELAAFRSNFDPWSLIIFSQYLAPNLGKDSGRQAQFHLFNDLP